MHGVPNRHGRGVPEIRIVHNPGVLPLDKKLARLTEPSDVSAFSNSRWVTRVPSGLRTSIIQWPCTVIPSFRPPFDSLSPDALGLVEAALGCDGAAFVLTDAPSLTVG